MVKQHEQTNKVKVIKTPVWKAMSFCHCQLTAPIWITSLQQHTMLGM